MENYNKSDDVQSGGTITTEAEIALLKRERKVNNAWNKFRRNKAAVVGLVIIAIMIFMAIAAPIIAPHDPNYIDFTKIFLEPGTEGHLLGTDEFGRDLLSRIIYGARVSVVVALGSTIVGGFIGILIGLISGYMGGIVDSILMRIVDAMFAFPFILLSIILVTILGSGLFNVILAIGITAIPSYARIVRGQVIIFKNEEYCNAERVLGASNSRILLSHIVPNLLSQVIVYATLDFANAIISEAGLSFLGLGILTPTPSWGNILRDGKSCLSTYPHVATIAGLFIFVAVIGINLFGDGIRDVMDPKMKK
ncbi:ABC transporter permease [Lutispora saccharofermentans]|uniref:ABC transporter permease n=1 Tax=Lutispora saccharofermentans TaxID=3024236 RepID=A0ABT1NCE1_9FIRM|nr:ABC transporter permease [Lutispora saccharofermentans]MCQ1528930.1 ABC transporter permease [Lutispora saccharofermentans]